MNVHWFSCKLEAGNRSHAQINTGADGAACKRAVWELPHLVEEQHHVGAPEPARVADLLKQADALLHQHHALVLVEHDLVLPTQPQDKSAADATIVRGERT